MEGIKNILIALASDFEDDRKSSALAYGISLARRTGAHVTVQSASLRLQLRGTWVPRFAAALVGAENRRRQALTETIAASARSDAAVAGINCDTYTPNLPYLALMRSFADSARLHDLTVVDAEPAALKLDRDLVEVLLMETGRPMIVVPPGVEAFECRRAIVAWDGSAKAARAANDALPFLKATEAVEIVSVLGEKEIGRSVMGAELAPQLVRHGIAASVNDLQAAHGDVAETLRAEARQFEADLVVMGGYVHSRLKELVLGGVTQSLLARSAVPLFMSY